jgi:hypothetical protein
VTGASIVPYHIAHSGSGYKVTEGAGGNHPGRTFSRKPQSKAKAEAQMHAIAMHEHGRENYEHGTKRCTLLHKLQKRMWRKRENYTADAPVNPWAVCHSSVGPAKSAQFERCVMDVKAKSPIKKD